LQAFVPALTAFAICASLIEERLAAYAGYGGTLSDLDAARIKVWSMLNAQSST
jgi:hypothetical protein